jgi:hypothetical protein
METKLIDSLVFSVTYENYMKNIKQDKADKLLGQWLIKDELVPDLKYAYAYLTSSDKLIVKKFHVERFEQSKDDEKKMCFIFTKSEDLFVDYPGEVVQGRQYIHSNVLDNADKISSDQVAVRMMQSKEGKSEGNTTKTKQLTTIEQLVKVKNEKFKDREFKDFKLISVFEKEVEQGKSAEEVLTNYFNSLDQ